MTTYFVLPARSVFPGVARVGREGARLGLWEVIYAQDHPMAEMGEGAVVVFGAWHDMYAIPVRRWKCHKFLLWTSPLAQLEFEPAEIRQVAHIRTLLERGHLDGVWCGALDTLDLFKEGKDSFMAPYPLSLRDLPNPRPNTREGHASLFCPAHPRKNIAVQLVAAKRAGLTVHLNGQSLAYRDLIEALNLPKVDHGWMPEDEYFATVASMDIGLQASHTGVESFNYVTWDHVMMGVPVVSTAEWYTSDFFDGQASVGLDGILTDIASLRDLRIRPSATTLRTQAAGFAIEQNKVCREMLEEWGVIG